MYAAHFDFVWRCLQRLGVLPTRLEDASQEVFVIVHRRLPDFRADSSMRTWLYGIVRRVAHNQRRSVQRKGELDPLDEEPAGTSPTPFEDAQDAQAADFVQRFLRELDPRKREIFALCMLEELSMPEVASALGVPVNTAYTRLRAARAEFRRALTQLRDDDER